LGLFSLKGTGKKLKKMSCWV